MFCWSCILFCCIAWTAEVASSPGDIGAGEFGFETTACLYCIAGFACLCSIVEDGSIGVGPYEEL